jgi:hypothetical protein
VGFAVQLKVPAGLPLEDCLQLERQLVAYAAEQGLQLVDHGLQRFVKAACGRAVTVNDQVALIDWLAGLPGLVAVGIGPVMALTRADAFGAGAGDTAFIQFRTADLALIGLTLLYRCGRITPALYLQILGGDVRPAHVH